MIRNQLFTICSRLKASDLVLLKRRTFQLSSAYQGKYSKNYIEANHDLLDVDEVLDPKSKQKKSKRAAVFDYDRTNQEQNRERRDKRGSRNNYNSNRGNYNSNRDNYNSNRDNYNSNRDNYKTYKKNSRNDNFGQRNEQYNSSNDYNFRDQTDARVRELFINDCQFQKNYSNQLILEGKYVINDVIGYEYPKIIRIYYSDEEKLNKINELDKLKENEVEFFKVNYELMRKYSDVVTPQGIVAVAEFEPNQLFEFNSKNNQNQLPLIVVLNNVRDPGNMGTIVRTSLACGVTKFLCLKKCVQLLKGKVIRSSSATVFKLPFIENLTVEDLKTHLPENATIYIADSKKSVDYNFTNTGVDLELKSSNAENNILDDSDLNDKVDNIKTVNYLDINYFSKPDNCIVLIVNGETGETYDEIQEFIKSKDCTRINIPLVNDVESLNTGVAASILMFELKRQFPRTVSNE